MQVFKWLLLQISSGLLRYNYMYNRINNMKKNQPPDDNLINLPLYWPDPIPCLCRETGGRRVHRSRLGPVRHGSCLVPTLVPPGEGAKGLLEESSLNETDSDILRKRVGIGPKYKAVGLSACLAVCLRNNVLNESRHLQS